MKMHRKCTTYLITLFLINALSSMLMDLSFDESYYWIYSEKLSLGYYDHPPLVAIIIRMGTTIFGTNEFGARFFFNILQLLSFCLIGGISNFRYLGSQFILFMALPLLAGAGLLALPDTVFLFFCASFFWAIKRYLSEDNTKNTLCIALAVLGMFYSKYHSVLVVLLTLMAYPGFFKRKSFWLIVSITIIGYLPHIIWQYQHDFISFRYHLFKRGNTGLDIAKVINYIISQFFILGMFAVFYFLKLFKNTSSEYKSDFKRILQFNSIGLLLILLLISFTNKVEANWSLGATLAIVLLVLGMRELKEKKLLYLILPSLVALTTLRVVLILPVELGKTTGISRIYEFKGWKKNHKKINDFAQGRLIVGEQYQICAKYAFYEKKPIPCLHLSGRKSQFSILNLEKSIPLDQDILYISTNKIKNAKIIEIGPKKPLYMKKYDLKKLLDEHGVSDEYIRKVRYN